MADATHQSQDAAASPRRFDIAFSYAGEQREHVLRLDAELRKQFPTERVFYDRRHEAELAGIDLDATLYDLYREQAELVVVCISEDYARKNWTNAEGKAIKDLMLNQEDSRVVLLRFDKARVRPIPDTAHYIDGNVVPIDQIVRHIIERHERVLADPPRAGAPSTTPVTVPFSQEFTSLGTLFKGREESMSILRESLRAESTHATAIVARQSIHGEGGVGKTRLALEFGLANRADYSALLFVQADSPDALMANLGALAGPLVLDLGLPPEANAEVKLAEVLRWLDHHSGWFLILDNVDTEEAAAAVEAKLAHLRAGHVVITSRISQWSNAVTPLELNVLDEDASTEFLLEATERRGTVGRAITENDEQDARLLAQDVDGLALALEQSAAYIRATGTTISAYRERWASFDEKVRGWHDERLMKYPRSVATTYESSLEQLPEESVRLLRICSLLAPAPIPVGLLEEATEDLDEALMPLLLFSLAKRSEDGESVTVHRLIQAVVASQLDDKEHKAAANEAVTALRGYAPDGDTNTHVESWPIWELLSPHGPALAEHLWRHGDGLRSGWLLAKVGHYLHFQVRLAAAEPLMRRALEIDEDAFGPEHPRVITEANNLAQLLHTTNRLEEAEPLMRRALGLSEQAFGPQHTAVAISLNNLAQLLQDTNRLDEAEPLLRRAIEIDEQCGDSQDPRIATKLSNLSQVLKATGRFAEAEPLMRRALDIDETHFGPQHHSVSRDLNNLALLLEETNRLAEAEPLLRRALDIDAETFGPEHPNVAGDLSNLAALLQATNRLQEAEPLIRRALEIDEQTYGPKHPKVSIRLNNLAQLLQSTNRLDEAEPPMRRALEIDEQSFGPEHPNVATRLSNLAVLLHSTNRLDEAESLMRRALEIDEQAFGPEHPSVALRLNNLAQMLNTADRLDEAEPLMRRALEVDKVSYGAEHPQVAIDLNNLAALLIATDRIAEAEPPMRRMINIFLEFTRSTGHQHPRLLAALANYRALLVDLGESKEESLQRVVAVAAEYGVSITADDEPT